jgi:hypothetical protein
MINESFGWLLGLYIIGACLTSFYVIIKKANLTDFAIIMMVIIWPFVWLYALAVFLFHIGNTWGKHL